MSRLLALRPVLSLASNVIRAEASVTFRPSVPACAFKAEIRNATCVVFVIWLPHSSDLSVTLLHHQSSHYRTVVVLVTSLVFAPVVLVFPEALAVLWASLLVLHPPDAV